MSFNYDKCQVMNFGKNNNEHQCRMTIGQDEPPHIIEKTFVEKDVGTMLSNGESH